MEKTISFIPSINNFDNNIKLDFPKPANNFLPDWWKNNSLYLKNEEDSSFSDISFKGCSPFLDSLISGYMLYTHQEIQVNSNNKDPILQWNSAPNPIILRGNQNSLLPVPLGCNKKHFAWESNFGLIVPKGYSMLLTHPLNRYDLPFISSSGIIDEECAWSGKFSFWIKEDFSGIIPINTPILQIIPFKRENWKSESREDLVNYAKIKIAEKNKYLSGFYKKFIRQKKTYK